MIAVARDFMAVLDDRLGRLLGRQAAIVAMRSNPSPSPALNQEPKP